MGDLMKGKRGLVMGVANHNSIAWGIARLLAAHGAEVALTYQGDAFGKRVRPLAAEIGSEVLIDCDVENVASVNAAFDALEQRWGRIDFVVHAIAFSDKSELKGLYADTTRENFVRTMVISCFSFTEVARRAAAIMNNGGSLLTLTYDGSQRVMPNYNVMGVAKAALEASVRYLAADFGPRNIRVNAISAGAMRTLSLAGISGGRGLHSKSAQFSLIKEETSMEGVAGAALWLCSDLGRSTTGEVVHVDAGFHMMGMAAD